MNNIYEILEISAKKHPNREFIRENDCSYSYKKVLNMVLQFASTLKKADVSKGDRIVIYCENSIRYVVAYYAVYLVGAVAVPVNINKDSKHLNYVMDKSEPKILLIDNNSIKKITGMKINQTIDVININDFEIATHLNNGGNIDDELLLSDSKSEDNAMIIFTSGTTASPKGVTLLHKNLIANTEAILEYLKITEKDSVLMTLPFSYSYGNSVLLTHTCAGATIVLSHNAIFPASVVNEIDENKITGFSTVGSYINLMLKSLQTNRKYFENVRYMTFAGEAINDKDIVFLHQNYPHIQLFVMYGQTEASARLSYLEPEKIIEKRGSIGRGLSNIKLKVVNDHGTPVSPGELGELIAKGPSLMTGYWKDPERTKEAIIDGWLYTNDLATIDEDGYIYVKGRKDDVIKHMGHRICPVEIENLINTHVGVKEAAVVEVNSMGINRIKAYIVLNDIRTDTKDVIGYIKTKTPTFMRPYHYEFINVLPKTVTGKIMRKELRGLKCVD